MGQPILGKPGSSSLGSYQPPSITSPPPATLNTTPPAYAAPPWGHSPSPPTQHPYIVQSSPPLQPPSPGSYTLHSYQKNGTTDHLLCPQNAYHLPLNGQGTLGPNMSLPSIDLSNVSVPNEGRMSIAVDFGQWTSLPLIWPTAHATSTGTTFSGVVSIQPIVMPNDLIGRLLGLWFLSHCWRTCPTDFELAWHHGNIPKGIESAHPNAADFSTDSYLSIVQ